MPARITSLIGWAINGCTFLVGLAGLLLYCRYHHPIWTDELLHFVMAGFSTISEAAQKIQITILTVNFNQTGVYMLTDVLLLKAFGASAFALRLPSILSTAWMMGCSAYLLTARGFGPLWRLAVVFALVASGSLMDYTAEARPYMPLAAATVGTLAFYCAPQRTRTAFAIGLVSIVGGALIHPYYPGYWIAVAAIGLLSALADARIRLHLRDVLAFLDARLLALGGAIYVAVGALTWMRGSPQMSFDPYQFLKADRLSVTMIDYDHLRMFYDFGPTFQAEPTLQRAGLIAVGVLAALSIALPRRFRFVMAPLVPPALIAVGSVTISAVLSWISYRHHYWILERQWIASLALMPIGVVWWSAELGRQVDKVLPRASWLAAAALIYISAVSFSHAVIRKWPVIEADASTWSSAEFVKEPTEAPDCRDENAWEALANANIRQGGPVWPVLSRYYSCAL